MKEKSDIKPIILKVGVALALSFASFLYSRLKARRVNRSLPPPPPPPQSPRSSGLENFLTFLFLFYLLLFLNFEYRV